MLLSDHDLRQINDKYLKSLSPDDLVEVSIRLVNDLKEAREYINQNPSNSSRPPSSREPWIVAQIEESHEGIDKDNDLSDLDEEALMKASEDDDSKDDSGEKREEKKKAAHSGQGRKPGKQKGAKGCGRTQKLAVSGEVIHRAKECAACGRQLGEEAEFIAQTGNYVIDPEFQSYEMEIGETY